MNFAAISFFPSNSKPKFSRISIHFSAGISEPKIRLICANLKVISISGSLLSPVSTIPSTFAEARSTSSCIALSKAGLTISISTPLSNLALASLLYPMLRADFLFCAGVKYAASSTIFFVLSSTSLLAEPNTPPTHTAFSLVAMRTVSLFVFLSMSSRVTIVSFSKARLTQR